MYLEESRNSAGDDSSNMLSLQVCCCYFSLFSLHLDFLFARITPNKRLEKWLMDRAAQMKSLDLDNSHESSRLAVSLIQALDDAKEFHQLEANLQV